MGKSLKRKQLEKSSDVKVYDLDGNLIRVESKWKNVNEKKRKKRKKEV